MNRIHKIIWSRIKQKWLVVSERAGVKGVPAISFGAASLAVMMLLASQAKADTTFLDFSTSGLTDWTTYGSATVYTSPNSYSQILGDDVHAPKTNYTLAPASGESMVLIRPNGSLALVASNIDTTLHLTSGTISNLLGPDDLAPTNFGAITKSFTLTPGTYTFSWAYAAADYADFNDGVLVAISDGNNTQTVKLLARIGTANMSLPQTGYPAGTVVMTNYGSTQWITYTFDITSSGTYWVSFADFNAKDYATNFDPLFFISNTAGTVSGGGDNITPSAPATAAQVAAGTASTVFDGGVLTASATAPTLAKNFTIKPTGGIIDQNGMTTTISGVIADATTGNPSPLTIKNTSSGGAVILTGNNTYTGTTTVEPGATLAVDGAIESPVIVETGGTLQGTGEIAGTINVSGTLAPGNSPGTLTATSTTTMASGSTLSVDIDGLGTGNGAGNYDQLKVIGAGSQFIIDSGASLAIVLRGISGSANNTFVPSLGDSFSIVTAEGGISGRFTTIEQPASGLADGTRFYAFYNAYGRNTIDLRVIPTSWQTYIAGNGGNRNAQSASKVLDQLITADATTPVTASQANLLFSVAGTSAAQLPGVATALAGEIHEAVAAESTRGSLLLQTTVSDRLAESPLCGADKTSQKGVWFSVSQNWDSVYGDSLASAYTAKRSQITLGGDLLAAKAARIGIGFSHADTDVSASYGGSGSATQDAGFVYGQFGLNGPILEGVASLGITDWKTSRPDPAGATSHELSTEVNGFSSMAGATLRIPLEYRGASVQPYASAVWVHSDRSSENEGSDSPAALRLPGYEANGTRVMAGVAFGTMTRNPMKAPVTLTVNTGIGHDSSELANPHVDANLAGSTIRILNPDVSQTFIQAKAGATVRIRENGYCYANFAGEFRPGSDSHGFELGVKLFL